jgi:hypothetical protein
VVLNTITFVTAIQVVTLRIRNDVTDSKIVSTFAYILYTRSTLPPCFTCTVSVYIVTIRSFSYNVIVLLGMRNLQMEAVKVGCYYVCLFDGVLRHFQQYFSYIVAVSFIGGWRGENLQHAASNWQTSSHKVLSTSPDHGQKWTLAMLLVIGTGWHR